VVTLAQSGARKEVDLPQFMIEVFTPGEIIEDRLPFAAVSVADALIGARGWIKDNMHHATHVRIVDPDGTVMLEKLRSES
jgi:hypothetical protein